jgi:hypothetical protein
MVVDFVLLWPMGWQGCTPRGHQYLHWHWSDTATHRVSEQFLRHGISDISRPVTGQHTSLVTRSPRQLARPQQNAIVHDGGGPGCRWRGFESANGKSAVAFVKMTSSLYSE